MNHQRYDLVQKDYHEESVLTPEKWFNRYVSPQKRENIQHIKKYIITFPYMEHLVEKVKSHHGKEISWYPQAWTFTWEGEELGLIISPVGAASTSMRLEEFIFLGGEQFILTGGVGVLLSKIEKGDIIIPNGGIRNEGVSYQYLPPHQSVTPSHLLGKKAKEACEEKNIKYHNGKVWSTDAVYRETPTRINKSRSRGAICVDMEATACFAVAKYRNVDLAAIFYGGDLVQDSQWNPRQGEKETEEKEIQEKIFHIGCSTLSTVP